MTYLWAVQKGNVQVIEDANTASLVIVGKDLKNQQDKITALEAVLQNMRSRLPKNESSAKGP